MTKTMKKDLLKQSAKICIRKYPSTSLLIREMKVPYEKAFSLTQKLEKLGIISEFDGIGLRRKLVSIEQAEKLIENHSG